MYGELPFSLSYIMYHKTNGGKREMSGKWYVEQSREPGGRGGPYYHETQLMESQGLSFSFDDPSKKLQRFPVAKILHIFLAET